MKSDIDEFHNDNHVLSSKEECNTLSNRKISKKDRQKDEKKKFESSQLKNQQNESTKQVVTSMNNNKPIDSKHERKEKIESNMNDKKQSSERNFIKKPAQHSDSDDENDNKLYRSKVKENDSILDAFCTWPVCIIIFIAMIGIIIHQFIFYKYIKWQNKIVLG